MVVARYHAPSEGHRVLRDSGAVDLNIDIDGINAALDNDCGAPDCGASYGFKSPLK
jgi:hypothetical protein